MSEKKEFVPFNGHSPLPWETLSAQDVHGEVYAHDGAMVSDCWRFTLKVEHNLEHANAEFIAEAANSYYPSREIIEKLVNELELCKRAAQSMVLSMSVHPDCEEGSEFDDISSHGQTSIYLAEKMITEARAFLNKNVKP